MKLLTTMFIIIFLIFYIFANVTIDKKPAKGIARIILVFITSFILTLIFGLPILGFISLF